jgi:hypothetical protein
MLFVIMVGGGGLDATNDATKVLQTGVLAAWAQ